MEQDETIPTMLGYSGNWWALALRAAAAIVFGLVALLVPGATMAAIVIFFGVYALVDGIFAVVAAIRGLRRKERWGAMLTEGILGILAGGIALFWPGIGALSLTFLVAAWALVTGAFEIVAAVKLRKVITGEWLLLLGGVLSIVLAILIALRPAMGAVVLIWWLGAYAIAFGAISLGLAIRVRRWTQAHAV